MRKKFDNSEIRKLAKLIDVIARKCWRGLPALLGDEPQPTREQIKEAFFFRPAPSADLGVRVQGGGGGDGREIREADTMIDEVDVVLSVVEWGEVVRAVRGFRAEYPENWKMYIDYNRAHEQYKVAWDGRSATMQVAEKFNVSDDVLRQRVNEVPFQIARTISQGYYSEVVQADAD